jgi:hypothetical protein
MGGIFRQPIARVMAFMVAAELFGMAIVPASKAGGIFYALTCIAGFALGYSGALLTRWLERR